MSDNHRNNVNTPKKASKLKMYLFPKDIPETPLPANYIVRKYRDENDILPWVEICKNGLLSEDADENDFKERITDKKGVVAQRDLFFIEHSGKIVGTVTAAADFEDSGLGCIHMVSVASEERGHGLGMHLLNIAERKLFSDGVKLAFLVTDDWRKAACKSYLKAGFYPVNYDDDMEQRWSSLLREFNIDNVMMVKNNGDLDKMIFAAEETKPK